MLAMNLRIERFAPQRRWPVGASLGAVVVALLSGAMLFAHEIGTTRVSVRFDSAETYDIEVVTDAATLVEKLEASAGASSELGTDSVRLQSLLKRYDEKFRERIKLAFNGSAARPVIAYFVAPATDVTSPVATIRLAGEIPPNARHFTWSYAWTFAPYGLTIRGTEIENVRTEWLEGGQTSAPFSLSAPAAPADRLDTTWRYFKLGFTHIIPAGLDHILFVLGIYLLSRRARFLLWQVSAFTLAHSITLGLSMLGLVAVSPRIVEPLIALSIAYIAIENMFVSDLNLRRVALVFAFGLLHGMGFAGSLKEFGMPRSEFLTALLSFNLGVEVGQLAVIGAAFILLGWSCAHHAWYRRHVVVPASAVIGFTAVCWTIQRLAI